MIDGKTRICGLFGNPVEHTLSPVIHNTLAKRCGINMVYVPFLVDGDQVKQAVEGARALQLLGVNVTVPHKSAVIPYLAEIDREASLIGAVNTLVPAENGFKGYNTDLPGLYRALVSEGISLSGEEVILLGAGGAARAAAFLCALRGAERVYLLNRAWKRRRLLQRRPISRRGGSVSCPWSFPAGRAFLKRNIWRFREPPWDLPPIRRKR